MTQTLAFGPSRRDIDLGEGLHVAVIERWLDSTTADHLFGALSALPFERRKLHIYGREVEEPRETYACGAAYTYSGLRHPAREVPIAAQRVIDRATREVGESFNQALVTSYKDGGDAISWHSDNEAELGHGPVIASVSLGATRRFRMRARWTTRPPVEIALTDGMLLVMGAGVQFQWQHEIPPQAGAGRRISITLRTIKRMR